jgi:acetate---CoA ligase (ADP-forming)
MTRQALLAFFDPRSIAVIGASADITRAGGRALKALASAGYPGAIYPVNPNQKKIDQRTCYKSIADIKKPVELAVLCIPAERVPDVLRQCGAAGVKAALVFADGFRDPALRAELDAAIVEAKAASGLRVIGPNTIGIRNSHTRAYPTFSSATEEFPMPGPVATIAQSGGLSGVYGVVALRRRGIGPYCVIDTGNECDVDIAECLDYLAEEPGVTVISIIMEGARDGRRLMAAVQKARASSKAVVFLKTGRSAAAMHQVASHTGALAGSADMFDAALRHAGATVVRDEGELLDAVVLHASNRVPAGRRLGVVTPSGGYAIITLDAAERFGMDMPAPVIDPTDEQRAAIRLGVFGNPFDMSSTVTAGAHGLATSLLWMAAQPNIDAILLWQATILDTPRTQPGVFAVLESLVKQTDKPVFCCGLTTPDFQAQLREIGVLWFEEPTRLVRALSLVVPEPLREPVARPAAEKKPDERTVVSGARARALLAELPHVTTLAVASPAAVSRALELLAAERVILKVESEHIAHKTEHGLVTGPVKPGDVPAALNQMREARTKAGDPTAPIVLQPFERGTELALGAFIDPVFGPSVMVALGGIYLEILRDTVFAPAPVTEAEARQMVLRLKAADILLGARGRPPADIDAAARALAALSRFIVANGDRYAEIDVNPLIVKQAGQGAVAVDALLIEARG